MNFLDITGQHFGRLLVLHATEQRKRKQVVWQCVCDCGNTTGVCGTELRNGDTRSCGCLQRERASNANRRHGATNTPEWNCWHGMIERCSYPKSRIFKYYGGRGITVCERWKSFEAFLQDMGRKPSTSHSIERADNDGNYEPANCRWALKTEQANNSRRCHFLVHQGEKHSISQWAVKVGLPPSTIVARLNKLKWSIRRALFTPVRRAV